MERRVAFCEGSVRRSVVAQAVEQAARNMEDRLRAAKSFFIKPDVGHFELQLAATHADALRGIVDVLRTYSQAPIVIGDAGHYGTRAGFRNFGYERLVQEYPELTLIDIQEGEFFEQHLEIQGTTLTVRRAKMPLYADVRISVATLKTHRYYGACLSIPNWVEGTWIVPKRQALIGPIFSKTPWLAAQGHAGAHVLIEKMYEAYPVDMGVIDGMLGMEGDGPVEGTPVHVGCAIAGSDAVAVDALGATLMGIDPEALDYLASLARSGKGTGDITKMDVPLESVRTTARTFALPNDQLFLRERISV